MTVAEHEGAPIPWPVGWRVERFAELPSTQDRAVELASRGEPGPVAVLALRQRSGRGRAGRAWSGGEGNLAVTFLLRPRLEARATGLLSLAAGVALHEAVAALVPGSVLLKWPNDLMARDAKLGGVLVEAGFEGEVLSHVAIGIGLNLAEAPLVEGRATTCLAALGVTIGPERLAASLAERVQAWIATLEQGGEAALRAAWTGRTQPLGAMLEVKGPAGSQRGRFAGLGRFGALLLDTDGGRVELVSGEASSATA